MTVHDESIDAAYREIQLVRDARLFASAAAGRYEAGAAAEVKALELVESLVLDRIYRLSRAGQAPVPADPADRVHDEIHVPEVSERQWPLDLALILELSEPDDHAAVDVHDAQIIDLRVAAAAPRSAALVGVQVNHTRSLPFGAGPTPDEDWWALNPLPKNA